jgi:stearoyl-CoA desaturase (Delta-9 desaturase)
MKRSLLAWIDNSAATSAPSTAGRHQIDWLRIIPFIAMHLAVFAIFWVGVSRIAVATAVLLYVIRMFAITAFYHRYFAHKAFKTSRVVQFLFAALGTAAVQRGPLWWAAHHRYHHAHSDHANDPHSPKQQGLLWSHTGWFLATENFATRTELIRDLSRFPELRFLDRFDVLIPVLLALGLFALGGMQLFIWGFCVSTVVLYHATFTVNSLAHRFGRRRYPTRDDSRNNWLIAALTLGEGWHNNHHYYPSAARQGFFWWEVDLTYYALRTLRLLGVVWDLRAVPVAIRDRS